MSGMTQEKIHSPHETDTILAGTVILIAGIGLVILYSASYAQAERFFRDPLHFLTRQLMFLVVALPAFLFSARVDLDKLKDYVKIITIGAIALQLLPFIPLFGMEKNGAHRWIRLGAQSFQPSEILKPALVLYLAMLFAKKAEREDTPVNTILPPLIITGAACVLVIMQNDFSTMILIALGCGVMFWIAGVPLFYFAMLLTVALPLAVLSVVTSEYRFDRIIIFLFPDFDPQGMSYQIASSLRAINEGGWFGKGIGMGTLKTASIPEVQSDFIFAAFSEETGFLGVLAFLGLWGTFSWRGYRAAFMANAAGDKFRFFLGTGAVSFLILQVIINVGVNAGAVPATGIPLPFASAGGSSLVVSFILAGFAINVSRGARARAREGGSGWQA